MANNYTPSWDEWAWTLHNTLMSASKETRYLWLLTNAIRAIYDTWFKIDDFIRYTWVNSFTTQRIQNWYLLQKLKYWYWRLHPLEAIRLEKTNQTDVENRQKSRHWHISHSSQSLIELFQKDIHYWLKNFVEILARSIVEERINATWLYKSVKVYLTSDADDVLSWVDLIVDCIDKNGKQHFIGIDVAVSENSWYLDKKSWNSDCKPLEFMYRNNIFSKDSGMPRIVFAMSPKGISDAIIMSIEDFEKWKPVTSKTISSAYSEWIVGWIGFWVKNLLQTIFSH